MQDLVIQDFLILVAAGFLAQLIDGALGMAYGTITTLTLLGLGTPPATASAAVHLAEIATCGASGLSHLWFKNVDKGLVLRLVPAGIIGVVIGATFLSHVDGRTVRPYIAGYLGFLGILILVRAWEHPEPRESSNDVLATPVGFVGGLLDSMGGGWGPIVTSTLVGRGHPPRFTVGSVNLSQTLVAMAASATFFTFLGMSHLPTVAALVLGGVLAAPFGGYMARTMPPRIFITLVGILVLMLAGWQVWRSLNGA
jgi:uncharacterized membrane protein YfcA